MKLLFLLVAWTISVFAQSVTLVNGASGLPSVAPNSFVSAYSPTSGIGPSDYLQILSTGQIIRFDLFWSRTQANAFVPVSVPLGSTLFVFSLLNNRFGPSSNGVTIAAQAPGIFQNGTPDCAVNVPNCGVHVIRPIVTDAISGRLIGYSNPAHPGQFLTVWATGHGAYVTNAKTNLPEFTAPPQVRLLQAASPWATQTLPLLFAGPAPGFAGLDQINFLLPESLATPQLCATGTRQEVQIQIIAGSASNSPWMPIAIDPGADVCQTAADRLPKAPK